MQRTLVRDLHKLIGCKVILEGWVQRVRNQKAVQFVVVRDETGMVQVVHTRADDDTLASRISSLSAESAIQVHGTVTSNERVKLGGLEIVLDNLVVVNPSKPQLPIAAETALDQRLDWRFLDLRRPETRLIFEVQTTLEAALREFWISDDFLEIHSPKFMAGASESGAELFRVEYFDRVAYLAQSPQFYKQMAIAGGFGKVFEIGPVFRANPSFTSRHDTEFTSLDVEIGWISSHEDVMQHQEALLASALGRLAETHGEAIQRVLGVKLEVPSVPFPRITLAEARREVEKSGHTIQREFQDLDPEGERRTAAYIEKEFGHQFVFVTGYPSTVRPFYHMREPDRPTETRSYDLLWKGLEITTGAQREHRPSILRKQLAEKGMSEEELAFYLDFFEYGCPPHGGFGMGLTRLLMVMLNISNVREVTFLYRGPNRLTP